MSYLNPIPAVRPYLSGAMSAVTYVVSATVQKSTAVASAVFHTIGNVASRAIKGIGPLKGLVQSYGAFYARSPAMAVVSGAVVATTVAYVAYQYFAAENTPVVAKGEETAAIDAAEETATDAPVAAKEEVAPAADASVVAKAEETATDAPVAAKEEVAPAANASVVAKAEETPAA